MFFKGKLGFFLAFYLIYGLVALVSSLMMFKKFRVLRVMYFTLIIIYSLYNPFGLFDSSRFKQYLIPFETAFIGLVLRKFQVKPYS